MGGREPVFVNSYDALFQSTARSSRACTVYLTQNLPSYFAAFGGANSRSEVEAFVGNLQAKLFGAIGDPTTYNWAVDSIGRTRQILYWQHLAVAFVREWRESGQHEQFPGVLHPAWLVQRMGGAPSERFEGAIRLWAEPVLVLICAVTLRWLFGERVVAIS